MKKYLIAIDLSSSCTGWAVFDIKKKELIEYGNIKNSLKGISTLGYPQGPLSRIKRMAEYVAEKVKQYQDDLQLIGIEEINMGTQRLGQKTLDGVHWFFLEYLGGLIQVVEYSDSDGIKGWRTHLGHVLSEEDKHHNKEARRFNKKVRKEDQVPLKTRKHVTARWANEKFGMSLDVDQISGDSDIADALGLGWSILEKFHKNQ